MVGNLQQVPPLAVPRQRRQDVLVVVVLQVARQQQALPSGRDCQHDGGAVDGAPVGEHPVRQGMARRPDDFHRDLPERHAVSLQHAHPRDAMACRHGPQLDDASAFAVHASLNDPADGVARRQPRQAAGVVFVGMGQHHGIDMAVPDRDALVQAADEEVRIRPTVDQHALACRGLQQDGVSLADIEDAHAQLGSGWPYQHERPAEHHQRDQSGDREGSRAPPARPGECRRRRGGRLWCTAADSSQSDDEGHQGDPGPDEVERRRQLEAGHGHIREQARASRHQRQRQPARQEQRCQRQLERQQGERDPGADPDRRAEHRQRHDRCHQQVGQG